MGIYTSNSVLTEAHDWASEIEADTRYDASLGCAQILADCTRNDMALFEATILNDIAEVRAVQEGVEVVTEAAFSNVIKKLVEMFKKLLAKIKGIFSAFLAKLNGAFRNGKDLVKKYEKQIVKYSNWKDFKVKGIREPKQDDVKSAVNTFFRVNNAVPRDTYSVNRIGSSSIITGVTGYTEVDKIKDADASDLKEAILGKYTSNKSTDFNSLHSDVMDELFKDEETLSGDDQVTSASFFSKSWIKGILQDDKWEKEAKKYNDTIEKNINTIIDNLAKFDTELAKYITTKGNSSSDKVLATGSVNSVGSPDNNGNRKVEKANWNVSNDNRGVKAEDLQKCVHALQKMASAEQEVITRVSSEYMSVVKFTLAQARKVWSAAAAWSSGVHKEEAEYAEAMGEVMADQLYAAFEA